MARRPTNQPTEAALTPPQMRQAIPRLKKRIEEISEFDPNALNSSEEAESAVAPLCASIDDALIRTFGAGTIEYNRFLPATHITWQMSYLDETPIGDIRKDLKNSKISAIALLNQAIKSLEERLEEHGEMPGAATAPPRVASAADSRKIFLVHGQDTGPRESVARFLERAGFQPIILHEQANQGRTIIEKFEGNADVGFAVVLLTPDDTGCIRGGTPQARARQNVILELGYFIGRLGRNRVCALKSGDLELPSDIFGVVWTAFDTGGAWKAELAKELAAAGYPIDWNKVMG